MKPTALLASSLLLAGCGGGGGLAEVNLRAGEYAGTYASTPQAPLPETEPLRTAKSGPCTATIASDGSFRIQASERVLFYGKAGRDGKDAVARCAVVADDLDGSGTSNPEYPATVAFSPRGASYSVDATALAPVTTPAGDAYSPVRFAISIAREGGPVASE